MEKSSVKNKREKMDLNVDALSMQKPLCRCKSMHFIWPKSLILQEPFGLITRRSKVQILPPPPIRLKANAKIVGKKRNFSFFIEPKYALGK